MLIRDLRFSEQGRRSDFQSGGGGGGWTNKRGHFLEKKKGTYKRKSQSENLLDIVIYPPHCDYITRLLSIIVSLYTSYKILFKHHTLQLGVMV